MRPKPEIRFFRPPGKRRDGSAFDREWRSSGREDELWAQVESWEETGYLPSSWHHSEPGTAFEALGPPKSTVRVYYAWHEGQVILLHVGTRKSGRGKLSASTKAVVEARLKQWKQWFPNGADLDDEEELLVKRGKKGGLH